MYGLSQTAARCATGVQVFKVICILGREMESLLAVAETPAVERTQHCQPLLMFARVIDIGSINTEDVVGVRSPRGNEGEG